MKCPSGAWGASALAIALLMSSPSRAQTSDQPVPQPQAGAEQPTGEYGEIVVTALRREGRLRDVPVAITALDVQTLERAGITNMRELGNVTPGLVFTSQGGLSAPTIRGIQSTLGQAGADSPTAIYIDGIYQPNTAANVMDIADIDRIEVLKGPQGTLFGRNATAGAIMIHTVDPSFTTKGRIMVSDGVYFGGGARTSHDLMAKGYVTGSIIPDKLAGLVSGFYEYVPGYLTSDVSGGRTGRVRKYVLRAKLLAQLSDNLTVKLSGLYSHRNDETAFASMPLRGNTNAQFYPDAIVPTKIWHVASELRNDVGQLYVKQKNIAAKVDWDIGDDVGTLSSLTSYLDIKARLIVPIAAAYAPSCVASFACILYDEGYPGQTFQQELNFTSAKYGRFAFVAGAMYYHDDNTLISNINPPLTPRGDVAGPSAVYLVGKVKTNALAGFGEATYDATDRLHLLAGIRYSWERRIGSGNLVPRYPTTGPVISKAWTPRASIRFDVTPQANVYFTYSRGFKSPTLDSSGQSNDVARDEKVTSYEVGTKIGTRTINLTANAFYYDYRDLQVQFFDGVRTVLSNASSARIWGFEGDLGVKLTPSLSVRLTSAWLAHAQYRDFTSGIAFALPNTPAGMPQVTVNADGHRMIKTPRYTGSATVNYETELANGGKVDFNATYSFVTHYWFDLLRRVDTGNYATVSGAIGYTPPGSGLRFSVFARNLTGEKYFNSALLGNQADAPVYSPPRQIGGSVEVSF